MHIQDDSNDNAVREMYDTSANTKWNIINDAVDGVEAESESAERECRCGHRAQCSRTDTDGSSCWTATSTTQCTSCAPAG